MIKKIDVLRLEPYLKMSKADCVILHSAVSNEIERLEKENKDMIVNNKFVGSKKYNNIAIICHLNQYLECLEDLKEYYDMCEDINV